MTRKNRFFMVGCLCLIGLLLIPAGAIAENWWESKQDGKTTDDIQVSASIDVPGAVSAASRTNWEDGYIEVMSGATADMRDTVNLAHAYSLAMKTARHLAYEKLAETVKGINLYSDATYDRELLRDSNLRTVVQAMIRGARVIDEKKSQFTDGSIWVEVTLGMKLFGEDGLIKPSMEWENRQPVEPAPAPEPEPVKTTAAAAPAPSPDETPNETFTGLIIDAGKLDASPAMLPKIKSEGGEILYGTGEISKDYVLKYGIMGYQSTVTQARNLDRVGNNPLVIRATAVDGKNKTDFVIAREDAERLAAATANNDFLKECRVVAVIN